MAQSGSGDERVVAMRHGWTVWRRRWSRRQWLSVGAAAAALLLVGGVGGFVLLRGPAQDTVDHYRVLAGIADRRVLRIGVFADEPLMAYRDPTKPNSTQIEDYAGFDIELARNLGRYLGFDEASLVLRPTEVQNRAQDLSEGRVDIIIASYSMTRQREDEVDFAGPYLMTKPEVLMRAAEAPQRITFNQLRERRRPMCTTGSSTSEDALRSRGITNVDGVATANECVEGLLRKKYDAFVLDRTVLAGFQETRPGLRIVDLVFGQSESLGIAVEDGNEALRTLVNNFLFDSYERGVHGAWARAWQVTFAKVIKEETRQPRPRGVTVRLRDYNDRYKDGRQAGSP
ncbi:hypothetical protein GCM10010124_14230 [Pilimelia terevasa]|uniref:Solute-binding protein family 3/N-terminal domain-containing protein n=1 Tax=Pilimelia terevasa TaxID=53372 RepID=A0A8J3BNZ1_9ACTN|nr:transporter substrate-binding domain-containing protein [Pilimelia terevasa]GGK22836.1 hypothetical protein GCM10010124_14230 [Pilimelia terevasa]